MAYYNLNEVQSKAHGQWKDIMVSLGVFTRSEVDNKKGMPCPQCGGNDRFCFNDHNDDGIAYCRQCDLKAPLDVVQAVKGCSFKEALKMVAEQVGVDEEKKVSPTDIVIPCTEKLSWKKGSYISLWNAGHTKSTQYKYEKVWPWFKKDKQVGYIGRLATKNTHQIYWTEKGWTQGSPFGAGKRPMFGSETLDCGGPVIIVEGEKTWQAAFDSMFGAPVITWVGGANAVHLTDYKDLRDREIVLCPDNDVAGRKAMKKIESQLRAHCKISWFNPPEGSKEKWDLADYQGSDMEALIQEHAEPLEELKEKEEAATNDYVQDIFKKIRPLGFNGKKVFFMPGGKGQVIDLSQAELTKPNLRILVRDQYWAKAFPNNDDFGKANYDHAACWVLDTCEKLKVFDASNLRGNGVWRDGKSDIVVHLGDRLMVNGEEINLNEYESNYIYSQRPRKINMPTTEITKDEKLMLVSIAESFNWKDKEASTIILSWIISSCMAAYLKWRPHIYITGPAGAGKSTVQEMFVKRCLEGICIQPEGDTTEPGLRAQIQNDSLPVVYDEPEGDSDKAIVNVKNVMRYARSSSSSSGGKIFKGSVDHKGVQFQAQSMFCFSSINTVEMNQQDRDRITKIELEKNSKIPWLDLEKKLNAIPRDMCEKLFLFVISNIEKIDGIIEAYKTYFAARFGSQRIGDQYGTLAAGKYILRSNLKIPTMEEIEEMEKKEGHVWDMVDNPVNNNEERNLLGFIRNAVINIKRPEGGMVEMTLTDIVEIAYSAKFHTNNYLNKDEAILTLRNYGIFIDKSNDLIYFSTKSEQLKKIFDKKPMYRDFSQIMSRMSGANKVRKRFNQQQYTTVSLPVKSFLYDAEDIEPIPIDEDLPF